MANHKSAAKRAVISEERRKRNSEALSAVRTTVRKLQMALDSFKTGGISDTKTLKTLFHDAQAKLGKAASKGLIKKETASRKTSRLAQAFKTVATATKK